MKNKWFSYIKIDTEELYVVSSGISFQEFMEWIPEKPENLLILQGYPWDSEFNNELFLDYIPANKIETFSKSDVYNYGNFCWVDFDTLVNVPDTTLAELLFFSHKARPLNSFLFECIHNRYAYFAHDDHWFVKVYMDDVQKYKSIIEYKILKELKGRKRSISPLPQSIMDKLYDLFTQGAVIDFEESYLTGVHIYIMGEETDMDGVHRKLDKLRKRHHGYNLGYDTDSKKWSLYDRFSKIEIK